MHQKQVKFLGLLYRILCNLLFIANSVYLSREFFRFPTEVKVGPFVPIEQTVPRLSLCFSLSAILGRTEFSLFPSPDAAYKSTDQLINSIPGAEKVIKRCSYRDFASDSFVHLDNSSACLHHFQITNFHFGGYICYTLNPLNTSYTLYSVSYTLNERHKLYDLVINKPLNSGYKVCPILHFAQSPLEDRTFNQEMLPSIRANQLFTLSYTFYDITRLTRPYESRCSNESEQSCYIRCTSQLHKATNNSFSSRDLNSLIVHHEPKYNLECMNQCKGRNLCRQLLTITYIWPSGSDEKLKFTVETISNLGMKLLTEPGFTFNEYFTQVASIAGIFLGFSMLRLFSRKNKYSTLGPSDKAQLKEMMRTLRLTLLLKANIEKEIPPNLKVLARPKWSERFRFRPKRCQTLMTLYSLVLSILVLSGFGYQVFNVLESYFKYQTLTKIRFGINPIIKAPNVSFCTWIELVTNTSLTYKPLFRSTYDETFTRRDKYLNFTLKETMDRTFPVDKTLLGCRFRQPNDHSGTLQFFNSTQCRKKIKITKFYSDTQICYKFDAVDLMSTRQIPFKSYPNDPGIFYSLIFSPEFAKISVVEISIFYSKLPLISRKFSIFHIANREKSLYLLSMHAQRAKSLPPPYDTRCNPLIGSARCFQECTIGRSLKRLNRLPFTEVINEPSNHYIITYSDLKNPKTSNTWFTIEKECEYECTRRNCRFDQMKSYISPQYRSQFDLEFAIDSHRFPDSHSKAVAKITLYDVYFQIFCCSSFWLNIALVYLNPSHLVDSKSRSIRFIQMKLNYVKKALDEIARIILTANNFYRFKFDARGQIEARSNGIQKFLLICLLTICCVIHSYSMIATYMKYPTVMFINNKIEFNSSFYDLTVCTTLPLRSEANFPRKLQEERTKGNSNFGFNNKTIEDIFKGVSSDNLLTACGYRGLSFSKVSNELTDMLYFYEYENSTLCNFLFQIKKFILQGMLCFKFKQNYPLNKAHKMESHPLNLPKFQYSLVLNNSKLGEKLALIVHTFDEIPFYSSIFSGKIDEVLDNSWHLLSYIRFDVQVMPPPYCKDGFTDISFNGCFDKCLGSHLQPFGLTTAGLATEPNGLEILNEKNRQKLVKNLTLSETEKTCELECRRDTQSPESLRNSILVTLVGGPQESISKDMGKTIEFFVLATDYPVTEVIFYAKFSFFLLFINLGSILGIWFGFSALHLHPKIIWYSGLKFFDRENVSRLNCKLEKSTELLLQIKKYLTEVRLTKYQSGQ